ncbi:aldo/keto reductase [Lactovum miscens]|uniref:Diketogulonate reductase-like aldo/keto reductase n=1 Tax=Lactovum miscens TaxID=190387 RepID=A0A841CBL7_9LACT|nr:aldo/keto reductase [Lactovum miscens]MBB5888779.1 diketogulonate reductase-like aldo/keto reductase [Lactovum miscens]
MAILTETYTLLNGLKIPKVGFGTWQTPDGDVAYQAVRNALDLGYRHIDTARVYGNEVSVGKAIKDSGIPREEIFLTTKLPSDIKTFEGTLEYFDISLKALNVEYFDLYLIHAPWPWSNIGANDDKGNREAWRAFEKLYKEGKLKAIGISNFDQHDMENLLEVAEIKPMINQIEYYVGWTEPKIVKFAKENGILIEAYSPLATGHMLENPEIVKMAEELDVSPAQLAIKFCLQNGVLPLPKATSREHIKDNTKLDFVISESNMKILNALTDTAENKHHATKG